ncbi:hypothetical protein [Microcystis phage MJing1]|nr:hypothetical protein [Microcystis phage MJing1]
MNWMKEQIQQPSTARGALALAALAGVTQAQPVAEAVGATGAVGLVEAVSTVVIGVVALWDILRRGRKWSEPGA